MADLVIKGGTLIDGTGQERFIADLVVEGDRITRIGRADGVEAAQTIDAKRKIVCPGFVDIHSHADLSICKETHNDILAPLIKQGVTTFMGGNCGVGLAPLSPNAEIEAQKRYLHAITAIDFSELLSWQSMDGYLSYLEKMGVAINVGLLCPHGLLRLEVMGAKNLQASPDQVTRMSEIVRTALEEGAFGLSTGLQYFPGLSATTDELISLAQVLMPFDGRFASHQRSYTGTFFKALDEVATVAHKSNVQAEVSHIYIVPWLGPVQKPFMRFLNQMTRMPDTAGRLIPERLTSGLLTKVMTKLEAYRRRGIRIHADCVPSTTGFTHLLAFFPPWALEGEHETVLARLQDRRIRREIMRDIDHGKPTWPHRGRADWSLNMMRVMGYGSIYIMAVGSEKNRHLQGMQLAAIAAQQSKHPIEAAMDLLLEEDGKVLVYVAPGEPEDAFSIRSVYPAFSDPETSIVTDFIMMGFGRPSWLFHGCFPKFLGHYVREQELLDLETAVRKCTLLPAETMGFVRRGRLAEGWFADIVVFDPKEIGSSADFQTPDVEPRGIEQVLINGRHAVRDGVYDKDAFAGRVLRRQ